MNYLYKRTLQQSYLYHFHSTLYGNCIQLSCSINSNMIEGTSYCDLSSPAELLSFPAASAVASSASISATFSAFHSLQSSQTSWEQLAHSEYLFRSEPLYPNRQRQQIHTPPFLVSSQWSFPHKDCCWLVRVVDLVSHMFHLRVRGFRVALAQRR